MNLWPFRSEKTKEKELIEERNIKEQIEELIEERNIEEEKSEFILIEEDKFKGFQELTKEAETTAIKINDLESRLFQIDQNQSSIGLRLKTNEENIHKLKQENAQLKQTNETQKEKIDKLDKNDKIIKNVLKELIKLIDELANDNEQDHPLKDLKNKRIKDLAVINKNFIHTRKLIKETDTKYQALLEILSEKIVEEEKTPDLFGTNVSLKKILQNKNNNNKSLLLSVVYLLKKQLDDKGIRI